MIETILGSLLLGYITWGFCYVVGLDAIVPTNRFAISSDDNQHYLKRAYIYPFGIYWRYYNRGSFDLAQVDNLSNWGSKFSAYDYELLTLEEILLILNKRKKID
jgi:hypothetical protein